MGRSILIGMQRRGGEGHDDQMLGGLVLNLLKIEMEVDLRS